jgi:hypothetical protein
MHKYWYVYKTTELNNKYLKDMELVLNTKNFLDYELQGGLLRIDLDYFQIKKELKKEINSFNSEGQNL